MSQDDITVSRTFPDRRQAQPVDIDLTQEHRRTSDISDWYVAQAARAADLAAQLERAIARKAPQQEIDRLAHLLEAAYYVGD